MKKEIYYSKEKLNAKIIEHYENFGIFEYSESKYNSGEIQKEFQFKFTDTDVNDAGRYEFLIVYNNDCKPVIDFDKSLVYEKNGQGYERKLALKSDNRNPNKPTLFEVINEMTEKQDKRDSENEQSAKDIEETNEILNLKNR